MAVMTQEERIASEKRVREALGIAPMGANTTGYLCAEARQTEQEILGAQAYCFGEIWGRPGLDLQTRCHITIAVLTSKYQHGPLADYVRSAIRLGIKPSEVLENMLQLSSYAGITAVSDAMNVARRVFGELGLAMKADEELEPIYPMDRDDRLAAVSRIVRDVGIGRMGLDPDAPPFAFLKSGVWTEKARDLDVEEDFNRINGEYGYGECWGREALGYKLRSFITMAGLQAMALNEQLHFHINNAINLGITGEEIHEALAQVGAYCGGANWRNAANVARDIFLQRGVVEPA